MSRYILPLIFTALLVSFLRLGFIPLIDVDEAVFSAATKEMVQTGNWITPTYNGENRYDKPILFYWLMALSYKAFGIGNFAARFPSALAAACLVSALFLFVRSSHGDKSGLYAAFSFMLSVYFLVYSHTAVTDMVLTLFISLSLFSFYMSGQSTNKSEEQNYIYGFYAFSALAFLTKGLIGIVFPFGIAMIYLCATRGPAGIRNMINLKGIVIFLLLSVPWYSAEFSVNGREFFEQFIIKHHFKRYAGVISGHSGPIYYYVPVLLVGLFPWIAFLPSGIRAVFRTKDKLNLFAFIWAAFVVVFFSFSTTKLPNYILPAIPAACIIVASGMDSGERKWNRFSWSFMAFLSALVCCGLLLARTYLLRYGIQADGWLFIAAAVIAAIAVTDLYALIAGKGFYPEMYGLMGIFVILLLVKALPAAGDYLQGTLYRYSIYARDTLPRGERIITYGINNPSIVFYSGHKIIHAGSEDDLKALLKPAQHALAIAKTKDRAGLEALGFRVVDMDARYALLERK